ncbi:MAG: sugar phosphate nucleotidyltransferase [Nanoarchaeota archaeon]
MKVIIPLAGRGTRLRPHTHTKPKPLMHVAGQPVLGHILDSLKGLDISSVYFATGHLKEQVEEYVKTKTGFKAVFREQKVMDGSAGAIRLFKDIVDEDVLIIFVDTIFETDLSIISGFKDDGIIWVKEVQDYQRFGVVVTGRDGTIKDMVEKPSEPISRLANIGLYYIKDAKLMFECIEELYLKAMVLKGEYYLPDAFKMMIQRGQRFRAVEVDGWFDCGKFETLLETNRILLQRDGNAVHGSVSGSVIHEPVYIEKDAIIEDSVIGPFVSVAAGAKITGAIIRNSIVNEDATVRNVNLDESIIGFQAVVEDKTRKVNVGDHSSVSFHGA